MNKTSRGKLILKSIGESEEQNIVSCLMKYYRKVPKEKLSALLKKTPVVLSRSVSYTASKKIILDLEKIGAKAIFLPDGTKKSKKAIKSKSSHKESSKGLEDILLESLDGQLPKTRPIFRYNVGLILVSFAMILLPLLYICMVCSVLYFLIWHIGNNHMVFVKMKSAQLAFLIFVSPIIVGSLMVLFMIKPFFVPRFRTSKPLKLDRESEPLIFLFVEKLSHLVGAPAPKDIYIDINANASASLRQGLLGIFSQDLVLTIGLPFASGLNINQFTGVLAHELGHFAQSAGMRLSYLIRLVNFWFERVVYEEDVWDRRMDRWTRKLDIRISFIFIIAKLFIFGTKKLLWLLMKTGHGISCFMLRQMEYDADRHEIAVSGSNVFESTSSRIVILAHAFHWAIQDLQNSWADNNRLVDNFPAMIVSKADTLPDEIKQEILSNILKEQKTGYFDTHPSDADRIAKADELNLLPLFRVDKVNIKDNETTSAKDSGKPPKASILFKHYDELARELSFEYYRAVLGNQVSSDNIINIDDITERRDTENECSMALMRFLNGQFSVLRPFGLKKEPIKFLADPDDHINRIKHFRSTIQNSAREYSLSITRYNKLYERINEILRAQVLLDADIQINPKDFKLTAGDSKTLEDALTRARSELRTIDNELKIFEKNNYSLMRDAVHLLGSTTIMSRIENAQRLRLAAERFLITICVMETQFEELSRLETSGQQLNLLAHQLEDESDNPKLNQQIEHKINMVRESLIVIKRAMDDIPYPFDHSQEDLTLGAFVLPYIPAQNDLVELIQAAFNTVDMMFRIYSRIAARLSYIAEIAEKASLLPVSAKGSDPPVVPVTVNIFSDFATKEKKEDVAKPVEDGISQTLGKMLQQVRSQLGTSPRSFTFRQKIYNHIGKPYWMFFSKDKRFECIFKDQENLFKNGTIVWGVIVQANQMLFKPGRTDCPGAVVFSLDPFFDTNIKPIEAIAHKIYEIKETENPDEDLIKFSEAVKDDYAVYFNLIVPRSLTQGKEVYLSAIMISRKHLPVKYLATGWFPLLVDPKNTRAAMVLPSKYWGPDLIESWFRD